jgi:hypothetical protein
MCNQYLTEKSFNEGDGWHCWRCGWHGRADNTKDNQ